MSPLQKMIIALDMDRRDPMLSDKDRLELDALIIELIKVRDSNNEETDYANNVIELSKLYKHEGDLH